MDCSQPVSSVHGISRAIILEWVAISFSRGSSQPRDWIRVSCIGRGWFFISKPPEKPLCNGSLSKWIHHLVAWNTQVFQFFSFKSPGNFTFIPHQQSLPILCRAAPWCYHHPDLPISEIFYSNLYCLLISDCSYTALKIHSLVSLTFPKKACSLPSNSLSSSSSVWCITHPMSCRYLQPSVFLPLQ